jgi:Methyltransferase domain
VPGVGEAVRVGVGKQTRSALYVHRSALPLLPKELRSQVRRAQKIAARTLDADIVKIHHGTGRVSFLSYPDFDKDPHPALSQSVMVDLNLRRVKVRDYRKGGNPPVLHRKESFVAPDYPRRERFRKLTAAEEAAGLLGGSSIGTRDGWNRHLLQAGFRVTGHSLVRVKAQAKPEPTVEKLASGSHKTAIARRGPSNPARLLIEELKGAGDVLDFGCGHGADVVYYRAAGLDAVGYDPYRGFGAPWPEGRLFGAVTVTYVLNVLPTEKLRLDALAKAASALAPGGTMYVTTRSVGDVERKAARNGWSRFSDGYLSSAGRQTFQKGMTEAEIVALAGRVGLKPAGAGLPRLADGVMVALTKP